MEGGGIREVYLILAITGFARGPQFGVQGLGFEFQGSRCGGVAFGLQVLGLLCAGRSSTCPLLSLLRVAPVLLLSPAFLPYPAPRLRPFHETIINVWRNTHTHTCTHTHTHMHTHTCTWTYTHAHAQKHNTAIKVRRNARAHTHMHTHTIP